MGMELLVWQNPEAKARGINPFDHGSRAHRHVEDAGPEAGAGPARLRRRLRRRAARRGEEPRQGTHLQLPQRPAPLGPEEPAPRALEPVQRAQAPGRIDPRVPISNWTELDVWQYIHLESIPIVPLYFAAERPVVAAQTAR
jgi:sulfate adenylyltransferase subunit 2